MPLKVNIQHLVTFYQVAKAGSFSQAAEELFLTEPAVNRQVRCLEKCFNVKLFITNKKKFVLTEAGGELLKYAEIIYEQANKAQFLLSNYRKDTLHIGVATTFAPIVAEAASEFERSFTGVKLVVKHGASVKIIKEFLARQHDIAVVVNMNNQNPRFRIIRLPGAERLVFVTSPTNPVAKKDRLELEDLSDCPLLLPQEGSGTREVIFDVFKSRGLQTILSILAESDYWELTKRVAEFGNAVALQPESSVSEEIAQGRLKVLPLVDDIKVEANVLLLNDFPTTHLIEEFIEVLRRCTERRQAVRKS